MENSNECKKNFVAVYDGSSAIEDLKVMQTITPGCIVIAYCITYLAVSFSSLLHLPEQDFAFLFSSHTLAVFTS